MKSYPIISFTALLLIAGSCNPASPERQKADQTTVNESSIPAKPQHLTKADFIANVYDFEKNPQSWVFKGNKPCIIDFYADWCGPCKRIAPILEDISAKYAGKINVYKINTDQEQDLARFFGISSIPTVLYCPVNGLPQTTQGAIPKETFEKIISEFLLPVPASK
jgi:thioredoxin